MRGLEDEVRAAERSAGGDDPPLAPPPA